VRNNQDNWQLPAEGKTKKTQLTTDNCRASADEVDYVIEQISDLITMESLKPWYCKAVYALGRERVLRMASTARSDGKVPAKFFSFMINRELKKHRAAEMRQPSTVLS